MFGAIDSVFHSVARLFIGPFRFSVYRLFCLPHDALVRAP